MVASGSTNSASADWGGAFASLKGGGGEKSASKSGEGSIDIQGDMEYNRLEGRATEVRASEHEGGL